MKQIKLLATLTLLCLAGATAQAAQYTWDTAPGTVGAGDGAITGGAGTWNLTTGNWTVDNGANDVLWGNGSGDGAIFGGTVGTVTINTGSGVTLNNLTVTNGYTFSGNTVPDTLNFAGTAPVISAIGTGTLTVNAGMTATTGLIITNNPTLTLAGSNSFTGGLTINQTTAGTMNINNSRALGLGGAGNGVTFNAVVGSDFIVLNSSGALTVTNVALTLKPGASYADMRGGTTERWHHCHECLDLGWRHHYDANTRWC